MNRPLLPPASARDTARAEIEALALSAETPEAANGYRHAALIIGLFPAVPRALRQLRQHAGFTGSSAKAAAYGRAADLLAAHAGEAAADPIPSFALVP